MKKDLTYDDIDLLCERISNNAYKCGAWWPTVGQIKEKIEPNLEDNIEFAIWISETANPPQTEQEKEASKYLRNMIYAYLDPKTNKSSKR